VLALGARQVGRRQQGVNSLSFVAAVMALFNPNVLWDVGFQLSFTATLGLVLYADPLVAGFNNLFNRLFGRWIPAQAVQRISGPVGEYLLFTLAAQVMILPVLVYHFQRLSLVSLLANPAILPAQPAVMLAGGLALLLGLTDIRLGQLAAWLAWPFAAYTIRAVEAFNRLPGGVLVFGRMAIIWVALYYAVLLGFTFFGKQLKAWAARRLGEFSPQAAALRGLALLGLLLLNGVVWQSVLARPDGHLHVTVLSVGSADALLVQTPDGRRLLIDGGPSTTRLAEALGRRLPLLDRHLDAWIVAAPSQENLAALPDLVERYPPAQVLWAGETSGTAAGRRLVRELARLNIPLVSLESGQTLDLGEDVMLRLLATGRRGAALLLEWGHFRLLLPLGVDFESLPLLLEDPALKDVTAVLLAESGYAPANPPELIEHLNPRLALISVAAGDWQGLPSGETLQALEERTVLRTDQAGWIELITNGRQIWVEVERK
jgi:competence protein ComEC